MAQQYESATSTPAAGAPGLQGGPLGAQHKRVYQACIPCRRRKVRCDLGSVDNPHDPPCVRCRRESKECFFSATRRKRRTEDGDTSDADEYTIRNGRKRLRASSSPPPPAPQPPPSAAVDRRGYGEAPLTPGGSQGRSQPLRRPDAGSRGHDSRDDDSRGDVRSDRRSDVRHGSDFGTESDANQQLENFEAQAVMRRGMYGPHDALDLLYKAATDSPATNYRRVEVRTPSAAATPTTPARPVTSQRNSFKRGQSRQDSPPAQAEPLIDPELTRPDLSAQPGYAEALAAWTRFRFVRAGWFTAHEAIEYIDYYYKYLSPLTPISPPTFSNPASHSTLLTEEPILSVTLLTIASRYHQVSGAGANCRSHTIHEQLWTYLRGMIERCLWGQEAFGGGFCGSGSAMLDESQTSSTAPWRGLRKGSLRTLGTIESLLILTEWHPRALHFPPAEATDELMLPSNDRIPMPAGDEEAGRNAGGGFGGRRIESWLEPAWRSDRMCWMLLSLAMGLAYELGVFDDVDEMLKNDAITRPEYREESYRQRANRIKRLLIIYTTQLAGRLGWTSMAPERFRKSDPAVTRRRPTANEETTPGTNHSSLSNTFVYVPDLELDDQIIHCWAGITNAMHMGNERLFKSRQHTTEIIQSGKYVELLRDFGPMLHDWLREFELFRLPPFIRHILKIEYEYVRIYVNSLSLQAVVERCTNNAGQTASNGADGDGTHLSPQTMINFGKLPLGQLGGFTVHDQDHVREVVEGCRNLLRTVVDGLLPGDYLKHAPVRTYFRIISGAMFLLKTFALGAPRSDVKMSIDLMDATVEALRNCVVDDVHLGIRYADLLESLTSRLRNRFIQAPTMQSKGQSPGVDAPAANGVSGKGAGPQNGDWAGGHAQALREGLNGQYRASSPGAEANNISATPFDLSAGNFAYPGGSLGPSTPSAALESGAIGNPPGAAGGGSSSGMDATLFDDWNNPGNEMWYLPPGPAFYQNVENNAVAMTAEGVNVGGLDLLEYMAMDPSQFEGVGGAGSGF